MFVILMVDDGWQVTDSGGSLDGVGAATTPQLCSPTYKVYVSTENGVSEVLEDEC